ncbi:aquaporin-8 isoform X2 [Patella vulgata]|uniref:aquaporin-8 isoform X2 n=1 Tax=Patella vulgata TaxID=6465 RepID=UPI00217FD6B3|nr:aquaporin-8 isoform X2 [Patella vulgata]
MSSESDPLLIQGDDGRPGNFYEEFIQPCLAELVAVTLFVFVGTMAVYDTVSPTPDTPASAVAVALAHGLTIAILVAVTGPISGGHINPAVTFAMVLLREMKPVLAAGYFVCQIIGALLGAAFTRAVIGDVKYKQIGGGAHTLGEGVEPGQGILCEILLTTVLILVILHVAVDPKTQNPLAPLAIGFAVTVDILAGISVTGASMNPARSFGPAVVISVLKSFWDYHYIYWVGPFLGSVLAAFIYKFITADKSKRLIFKNN